MGFTEEQIENLSRPLNPDVICSRSASGRNLSYIEGWHAIAEANRIFGFDAWDRTTVMSECVSEYMHKTKTGREMPAAAYRARVRVCVSSPGDIGQIIREGSGHGTGFGATAGEAHESAEKEAETDAMKRALSTFGNQFGLALYDKQQRYVDWDHEYDKDKLGADAKEDVPAEVPDIKGSSTSIILSHVAALDSCENISQVDKTCAAWREKLCDLPRGHEVIDSYQDYTRARVAPDKNKITSEQAEMVKKIEDMKISAAVA